MTHKVGRVTLAIALIGIGAGFLMDNLYNTNMTWFVARMWPGLLMLLGLEWLWATARSHDSGERMRTDGGAIFLLVVLALIASVSTAVQGWSARWFRVAPHVNVNVPRVEVTIPAVPAFPFGNVPAVFALEQELDPAQLKELVVSTSSASIIVQEGPRPRVELKVQAWGRNAQEAEEMARMTQLKVDASGGRTVIRGVRSTNTGRFDDEFLITLPRELATALRLDSSSGSIRVASHQGSVNAQTSSGSVRLEAVRGNVDVRTSSGAITVAGVEGNLAATASSGGLRVEGVQGNVQANSTSGSVTVLGVTGKVSAQTSSGAINVTADKVGGDYDINAVSGSVHLTLPAGASVNLSAKANSGTVSGPNWLTIGEGRNSGSGILAGGEYKVTVRTSSGSIRIDER